MTDYAAEARAIGMELADRPALRPVVRQPKRASDVLTEAGAAERFAQRHGDDLRFDHRRQRWLLWQAHRWVPDTDAGVMRLAFSFARAWQREAIEIVERGRREAVIKFAIGLEQRAKLLSVLGLARTFRPIADSGDGWDADAWLLGVPNGVIDLRTGLLRPAGATIESR